MKKLFIAIIIFIVFGCNDSNQNNPVIGTSKKIGFIEIAEHDFTDLMNWEDAKKACGGLGSGWRLPTKGELNLLYANRSEIGGFKEFALYSYWSSEGISDRPTKYYWNAWAKHFSQGDEYSGQFLKMGTDNRIFVRAVRTY